jgi:hypothetical protein
MAGIAAPRPLSCIAFMTVMGQVWVTLGWRAHSCHTLAAAAVHCAAAATVAACDAKLLVQFAG